MNLALINIILFNICTSSQPLNSGSVAPCTGILWTIENTRNALKCKRTQLPIMTANWHKCEELKKIENERLQTKIRTAHQIIDAMPQTPHWVLPAVSVGSFLAGALSVALLAGAL